MTSHLLRIGLLGVLVVASCASPTETPASGSNAPAPAGDPQSERNESAPPKNEAPPPPVETPPLPKGPPASILPVSFQRPDTGTPLTAAELEAATDKLIELLKDTRYFDFVDERVHGWPESDPNKGYWYGHFWTGVTITKNGGTITFKHPKDGSDNVGIATAPYLEGTCYGHLMWGAPKTAHLVRRMVRAYTAWILAMKKSAQDANPTLLSRAFYRPNIVSTDGGRTFTIDYSATFPGEDADPSSYVQVTTNPTFGSIYIKNKRSKDDIGHMLRSMTQVEACSPRLDAAGQAEIAQMNTLFSSWASRVDAQGFVIETLDKQGNLWAPPDQLARYTLVANAECLGALALRLKGQGAPGSLDCQSGVQGIETAGWSFLKNDARQILRTNHAAALVLAYQKSQLTPALALLQGLVQRVELDLGIAEGGSPPQGFNLMDVASTLAFAANVGVPLTSREVRWIHARLAEAHVGMRAAAHKPTFSVFDAAAPDGTYSYDPPNVGLFYRDLGMLIGSCASPYRNPTGRPLLDCKKLLAAF